MLPLAFLLLLSSSPSLSKLSCKTPVVCDPSLESDIFIKSSHYGDENACETSCTIGHPNNPCKFFTRWRLVMRWLTQSQDLRVGPGAVRIQRFSADLLATSQRMMTRRLCGLVTTMFILMETRARQFSRIQLADQRKCLFIFYSWIYFYLFQLSQFWVLYSTEHQGWPSCVLHLHVGHSYKHLSVGPC